MPLKDKVCLFQFTIVDNEIGLFLRNLKKRHGVSRIVYDFFWSFSNTSKKACFLCILLLKGYQEKQTPFILCKISTYVNSGGILKNLCRTSVRGISSPLFSLNIIVSVIKLKCYGVISWAVSFMARWLRYSTNVTFGWPTDSY